MFSTKFTVWLVTLVISCSGFSQVLNIEHLSAPSVDGVMQNREWGKASQSILSVGGTRPVQVIFQRTDTALYFAFAGNLSNRTNPNFPEIYLDMNNSKSTQWEADDHWFHVSATDCHFKGKFADYSNCTLQPKDWSGNRNWAMSAPDPDTVEIIIPFRKIGLDLARTDSIGIAFGVTNTVNRYNLWPDNAKISDPSTWATAYFMQDKPTSISNQNNQENQMLVYPNPVQSGNPFLVEFENVQIEKIKVFDVIGQEVEYELKPKILSFELQISIPGTFFLVLTNKQGNQFHKTLIVK